MLKENVWFVVDGSKAKLATPTNQPTNLPTYLGSKDRKVKGDIILCVKNNLFSSNVLSL